MSPGDRRRLLRRLAATPITALRYLAGRLFLLFALVFLVFGGIHLVAAVLGVGLWGTWTLPLLLVVAGTAGLLGTAEHDRQHSGPG